MNFNDHSNLEGLHAPFGASQSAWLRYDETKIIKKLQSQYRAALGTEIHEFSACQIELGIKHTSIKNLINAIETYIYQKYKNKTEGANNYLIYGKTLIKHLRYLPKEVFETVKAYINDAIGFKMDAEKVLYYSENFFGTADAIYYRDGVLRIHDLKTGDGVVHMEQLLVYVALFCLEYKVKPAEIECECRIYQNTEILCHAPEVDEILPIMDKIVSFNKLITKMNSQEV